MNIDGYEARLANAAIERATAAEKLAGEVENGFVTTHGNLGTHMLALARASSIDALIALIDVDPEDPKAIRHLQNEVKRFREIASWMFAIADDGREAWISLTTADQEELARLINPSPQESEDV